MTGEEKENEGDWCGEESILLIGSCDRVMYEERVVVRKGELEEEEGAGVILKRGIVILIVELG